VKVKIYNYTRKNIDSLIVGKVYIGHLAKDSATSFLSFTEFCFDSGLPCESMSGKIDGIKLTDLSWSGFCGTFSEPMGLEPFFFDLRIRETAYLDYLELIRTKEK